MITVPLVFLSGKKRELLLPDATTVETVFTQLSFALMMDDCLLPANVGLKWLLGQTGIPERFTAVQTERVPSMDPHTIVDSAGRLLLYVFAISDVLLWSEESGFVRFSHLAAIDFTHPLFGESVVAMSLRSGSRHWQLFDLACHHVPALLVGLRHFPGLLSLALDRCQLSARHVSVLTRGGAGGSLRRLRISGTRITRQHAWYLCKWIRSPECVVEELDLSNTELAPQSLKTITSGIARNATLHSLMLADNCLDGESVIMLAAVVRNRIRRAIGIRSDSVLNLSGNPVGIEAATFTAMIRGFAFILLDGCLKTREDVSAVRTAVDAAGCDVVLVLGSGPTSVSPSDQCIVFLGEKGAQRSLLRCESVDLQRVIFSYG